MGHPSLLPVQHPHKSQDPNRADSLVAKGTDSNRTCMLWCMTDCNMPGLRWQNSFHQDRRACTQVYTGNIVFAICPACNLKCKPTWAHTHKQANKNINNIQRPQCTQAVCVLATVLEGRSQQLSTAWGLHTCLLTALHALQADEPPKMQAQQMHLPVCGRRRVQAGVVCRPAPLCSNDAKLFPSRCQFLAPPFPCAPETDTICHHMMPFSPPAARTTTTTSTL